MRIEERIGLSDRRQGKIEEILDRIKVYTDKMEKKLKDVVEQNVSIKILVDSMKTK
jgi:hypothetical protein